MLCLMVPVSAEWRHVNQAGEYCPLKAFAGQQRLAVGMLAGQGAHLTVQQHMEHVLTGRLYG